jgi:hypothetical protein
MKKKVIVSIVTIVVIFAVGMGFWKWIGVKNNVVLRDDQLKQVKQDKRENNQQQQGESNNSFVVDVNPDMNYWQTKGENEAFTIKFPKEWYWLESDREKTGYGSRVITNNQYFDINKYADIGIFTGGNYLYFSEKEGGEPTPIQLSNTEVVITNRGSATTDAGTPQDSLDSKLKWAKENSVNCKVINNKTIPYTAYCTATYNSELQQSYYIINKKISLVFTARTSKDTLVKKEILDKIAGSIVLK